MMIFKIKKENKTIDDELKLLVNSFETTEKIICILKSSDLKYNLH